MSLSSRFRFWLAVFCTMLPLAGCFQPVYAPVGGRDIQGELAAITIAPVEDRLDRKSTRLNSSHIPLSRMPSSA